MATTKDEVRKLIDQLPERVERGLLEAREGKFLNQDDVEERMKRWLND